MVTGATMADVIFTPVPHSLASVGPDQLTYAGGHKGRPYMAFSQMGRARWRLVVNHKSAQLEI